VNYERDPSRIYAQSFATVRSEVNLSPFPEDIAAVAVRIAHASGMVSVVEDLAYSPAAAASGQEALKTGAPVICDCQMVASGIIRSRLPKSNPVVCTLNEEAVPQRAEDLKTTRSAAAVDLWPLQGAVIVIGNAPTALFRLLERLDETPERPALILGFPVGFVGAAESKAELAADPRGVPFITLSGRRGGSAMASAALNAVAAGLPEEA
jgi:precorrin-8X/cobalt-precorrin-8 methylmutase